MTPDDVTKVQAAAERVRRVRAEDGLMLEVYAGHWEYDQDCETLADAYLALAPVRAVVERFMAREVQPDDLETARIRMRLAFDSGGNLTLGDVRRAAGGDQPAGAG